MTNWSVTKIRQFELPTSVLSTQWSDDGRTIWAACLDGGILAVDAESGEHQRIASHESYASGVVLAGPASSRVLVSAGYDGVLAWHDPAERETIRRVAAHSFWSWQLAASADGRWVGSVSGQYLCGSQDYKPRPATEPTVKVFDSRTGELVREFEFLPPVLSLAFSADGELVAAGNLMGDVRIWRIADGQELASWNTPSFTGWGIIKGHYYTGGIYAMSFGPDGEDLWVAGMGKTVDPAAGNGRQLWERFAWRTAPVEKRGEPRENDIGQGLLEALRFHPVEPWFVLGGRVAKGAWNLAFFSSVDGSLVAQAMTETRVTSASFDRDGKFVAVGGAVGQNGRVEGGGFRKFGRIGIYSIPGPVRVF
jgi:WD40 repeat protein